ncbi:MAG: metal-sensitive transcriptional regulator [Candidatus Bipolaricaulota bacterium]|nr:metal-sensitive transcriptional regulator [Candidatus Bipolaricaulota bacterium]MBS3791837.1 metal-sensitive transcriptional regulator [Candidatus Bipolaricaulota bacterium]
MACAEYSGLEVEEEELEEKTDGEKGSLEQLPTEKQEALNRIRTVIGHSRGIEKMIEEERYCIDILKQIAAVQSSLSKLANLLTKDHMRVCVSEAVKEGKGEDKIEELVEVLKYLRGS